MSTSGDNAASRLSKALDDIFGGGGGAAASGSEPTEPYELPEIVPATADWSVDDDPPQAAPSAAVRPHQTTTTASAATPAGTAATPPGQAPAQQPSPAATQAAHKAYWAAQSAPPPVAAGYPAPLRAPGRRPRVRKVTRVLRHIDPWSTFKVALIFSAVTYLVLLTSGVLLWRVADSTGTIDNVERWFTQFGWETFELKGDEVFDQAWVIGLFAAVGLTGVIVLAVTLFNLVSDIVGGVRVTVLEEEVVERTISSTRRYVVRRPPVAGGTDDWDVDSDDAPASPDSPAAPAAADWTVDD